MSDSIILLGPIEVDSATGPQCVDEETHFTDPIIGADSSVGSKMPDGPTGDNVFNIYIANPTGSDDVNGACNLGGAKSGSVKFGVTPCAEKIEFDIVGRADDFSPANTFDTLIIKVDGSQVKKLANGSGAGNAFARGNPTTGFSPPLRETIDHVETFTHNFTEPEVCGHIVEITGSSGNIANNKVGYDVKITVTLRTTQI